MHIYAIPIPRAFFHRGKKSIRLTLAHDPMVRATRARYLSNRLSMHVYRGISVAEVQRQFAHLDEADQPPKFPDQNTIRLRPSNRDGNPGANQFAEASYAQGWDSELRGSDIVVAVRCTERWPTGMATQPYALAMVLETAEIGLPLYDELRARLPLLSEVEVHIELS